MGSAPSRAAAVTRAARRVTRIAALAVLTIAALAAPPPVSAQAPRDLSVDEERGGHTLARHVGLSDDDLRRRLRAQRGIAAASTYTDRGTAERIIGLVLAEHRGRIERWVRRGTPRPNLALDYTGARDTPIGRSLRRGDTRVLPCWDAVVVLRWDPVHQYVVLTSYPERRR